MESIEQFKKNVQASFGYVKKDLLMVNDAISDIHDKIQNLIEEIGNLKRSSNNLRTSKMVKKK